MNDTPQDVFQKLYDVIDQRRNEPQEGSYTSYLFSKGLDKILKKIGEESTETVIAAKNGDKEELVAEIADLFYHVIVLMRQKEVPLKLLTEELERRGKKLGNLKTAYVNPDGTL